MKRFIAEVVLIGNMKLTFENEASSAHEAYMMLVEDLKENGKEGLLEKGALQIKIEAVKDRVQL